MKGLNPIPREDWHPSQRGYAAGSFYNQMLLNDQIVLLTGDLGYGMWDKVREDFPERFYNCGAAEFSMLGIAVGLAMEGKIPVVYSITPFLLWRGAEIIRNYINKEMWQVKLIGSGRDSDYAHDGFSHWAGDDTDVLKLFPNIYKVWPRTKEEVPGVIEDMIARATPYYVNLSR